MPVSRAISLLTLVLAHSTAQGQTHPEANGPNPPAQELEAKLEANRKAIENAAANWLKTCLADWDQATHMSKDEWATTCRRVSAERRKFFLEEAAKGINFESNDKAVRKGIRGYLPAPP
jgi:hypothetical protein